MKLKIQFLHIFQLSSEGDQGVLFVMYIFLQQSHRDLNGKIRKLILLPEKFLPFDWLRAEVFQLNLKYLHVKMTVTMVTPNHHGNHKFGS